MKAYSFSNTKCFWGDDEQSVFVSAHVLAGADDRGIIGLYVTKNGDVVDDDHISWRIENDIWNLGIEPAQELEGLLDAWYATAREIAERAYADR